MSATVLDGRVARGERTRRRVAEGLVALLEAGVAEPTARQVAERAGVSLRIVFHHYEDMEQVLRAAVAIQAERHWSRARPVDPSLPLAERVSRLVRQRGALFDAIAPVRRAAGRVEHRSPTVAAELGRSRKGLRRELEEVFGPELIADRADRAGRVELLDALDVAAGWDAWDQLRHRQGQAASGARRVVARMLTALLDAPEPVPLQEPHESVVTRSRGGTTP
ncbi:MAG TPA: TetR/AcrR family transcriptional regulator [Acidimicrobiales bacterium]|nr:TetR/AcrR family transcriptional regulator [Acidimicrobiales bacterium]